MFTLHLQIKRKDSFFLAAMAKRMTIIADY